ncbi:MAG: STT3 domain-containing protein [Nanoarchaeota archaeon]
MAKGKRRRSSNKSTGHAEHEKHREHDEKSKGSHNVGSKHHKDKHKKGSASNETIDKIKSKIDSLNVNWALASKIASVFVIIAFILISMFAAVHYRMYTDDLPMVDEMVEANVMNMLEGQVANQIDQQYPNLPADQRDEKINEELQKLLEEGIPGMGNIEDLVAQQAEPIRSKFKNNMDGHTYLLGIDSYYFLRHTENYLETGNIYGAESKDKYYDHLQRAGYPENEREPKDSALGSRGFHILLSAWVYQAATFFNPDISVMGGTFYVPMVIAALCVIPAFFIGRKIAGNFAGFFSALLIALHPAYLSRTPGGFTHTEGQNVLFPLLAAWFIIEALTADSQKKAAMWSALSGLAIGVFSFTWGGWSFMLWVVFLTALGYTGYLVVLNYFKGTLKEGIKELRLRNSLIGLGVFSIASFLFVGLLRGFDHFTSQLGRVISFLDWRVATVDEIWSNVMGTVAELNPLSAAEAMANISMGSSILMIFAFVGFALPMFYYKKDKLNSIDWIFFGIIIFWAVLTMVAAGSFDSHFSLLVFMFLPAVAYAVVKAIRGEDVNPQYTIFLLVWFTATFYSTTNGVRFGILVVPVFSIAAGVTAGLLVKFLSERLGRVIANPGADSGENKFPMTSVLVIPVMIFVFLIAFVLPFSASGYECGESTCSVFDVTEHLAKNQMPQMNDQWYETLDKINREADEDAIIGSWWDFGHWFAAIGQRPATLDGARQSSPEANWLGKLMVTESEDESIGILRYLACGSNRGYESLIEHVKEEVEVREIAELETMRLLDEIIPLHDKAKAKEILSEKIGSEDAEEVLKYTHCENPPQNYYITSEDMVGKSGVWAHFGSWDFEKAAIYNIVSNYRKPNASDLLEEHFDIEDGSNKYEEVRNVDPDQWISSWPSYMDETGCSRENNDTIVCENSISAQQGINVVYESRLNLETGELNLTNLVVDEMGNVHEETKGKPKKASFVKDDEFVLTEYDENTIDGPKGNDMGVAIFPTGTGSYRSVIMDHELTGSMFTRLFHFENVDGGMPYEEFNNIRDVTGQKIITWTADWPEMTS